MSERHPDFDELVGPDLDASERERLRRVHDALLAAGPPPDLGPRLGEPPVPSADVVPLAPRRRRRIALVALAAALAWRCSPVALRLARGTRRRRRSARSR